MAACPSQRQCFASRFDLLTSSGNDPSQARGRRRNCPPRRRPRRSCYAMGRPPICTCGTVELWVGQREQLDDQPDAGRLVQPQPHRPRLPVLRRAVAGRRRWPVEWRFLVALAVEAAWEIIENTPMVIDRYREATAALGYNGDSVLNSLSDIAMMGLGFLLARKLPLWVSIARRAGARTGPACSSSATI